MSVFRRCLLVGWGVLGCTPLEPGDALDARRVGDSAAPGLPCDPDLGCPGVCEGCYDGLCVDMRNWAGDCPWF